MSFLSKVPHFFILLFISLLLIVAGVVFLIVQLQEKAHQGFEDVTSQTGIIFENPWTQNHVGSLSGVASKFEFVNIETLVEHMGGGLVAADFDNDNLVDLYFVSGDFGHLFWNRGNFQFQDITQASGLKPLKNGTGALAADYNNDGWADLLLYGVLSAPRLYQNQEGRRFVDVTKEVGLQREGMATFGATFGDYNSDGWLDLYLVNYNTFSEETIGKATHANGQADVLFENRQGRFVDVSQEAGIQDTSWGLAAVFFDYNKDTRPDILVANDFDYNILYTNIGDGRFRHEGEDVLARMRNNGMGIALLDYQNDGWLDAYITNIYFNNRLDSAGNLLYENAKGQGFYDIAASAGVNVGGWSWGVVSLDYDNDGDQEVAVGSGFAAALGNTEMNEAISDDMLRFRWYFFEKEKNDTFKEQAQELGLVATEDIRGVVRADLNNDGNVDLVANHAGRKAVVYKNKGGTNQNWLLLKLVGKESNRHALGAKVWVDTGERLQFQEVYSGGAYLSGSDTILHFGLGKTKRIQEIRIQWPSGKEEVFNNIQANQRLVVEE